MTFLLKPELFQKAKYYFSPQAKKEVAFSFKKSLLSLLLLVGLLHQGSLFWKGDTSENQSRTWNLFGPDRSGTYGGAQGIGGLEAQYNENLKSDISLVNNFFGDVLGTFSMNIMGANLSFYEGILTSYGLAPGSTNAEATQSLQPQWRGHYLDQTGFYYMGARYYDPVEGRFISADPLGHGASMSLYDYCNGDPVNGLDPDGRCVEGSGGALYDMGTGAYQLGKNVIGSAGYAVTSGFGNYQNGASDYFSGSWQGLENTGAGIKNLGSQLYNGNFATVGVALTGGEGRSAGYRTGYALTSLATILIGGEIAGIGEAGEVDAVAESAATEVSTGPENIVNGLQLNKSLASQAQMGEAGETMAGIGRRVPFRDAERISQQYGGSSADWVKKTSSSYTASDGVQFETHWVENIKTGQRVEFKTKLSGGN